MEVELWRRCCSVGGAIEGESVLDSYPPIEIRYRGGGGEIRRRQRMKMGANRRRRVRTGMEMKHVLEGG
ncbi:hypothetical protein RHMOL_Rhmol09G0237500 [Rhododendron molle]|uniref:Uncharacterized protein n=1 Tax=Rhododendron molle TaxID=49168 RepID=A0ACC0MGE1_RHOML|nr:hypothetical protein RHMOL_Rhmol09G0237500 [Rhododendron molle]